jgi:hypothetical protein
MIGNTINLANVIFDILGIIALIVIMAYLAMGYLAYMLTDIFTGGKK